MIVWTLPLWRTKKLWISLRYYKGGKRWLGEGRNVYETGSLGVVVEHWT